MRTNHNTHLIPNGCGVKSKSIMLRKWDYSDDGRFENPSKKILYKQITTLHKKLKKKDEVYTEYSIEKDKNLKRYHVHMLVKFKDEENMNNNLMKFIGGKTWIKREVGLDTFNECNGKYGLIHTEDIRDENKFRKYINKSNQTKYLI